MWPVRRMDAVCACSLMSRTLADHELRPCPLCAAMALIGVRDRHPMVGLALGLGLCRNLRILEIRPVLRSESCVGLVEDRQDGASVVVLPLPVGPVTHCMPWSSEADQHFSSSGGESRAFRWRAGRGQSGKQSDGFRILRFSRS